MFQFKQFIIHQQNCAMKVGTDGVLLGAWVNPDSAGSILDVGTGTGLIALMMAQRCKNVLIDAIEIELNAFNQACENVRDSKWAENITVIHTSLQTYFPAKQYELIIANPPYFSNSLKNPNIARSTARHTDSLSLTDLFRHVKRLMSTCGRFCMVFPASELNNIMDEAQKNDLFCIRLTNVFPRLDSTAPKRVLMEFALTQNTVCTESSLYIEKTLRHEYTDQYKELTKDFYLEKK